MSKICIFVSHRIDIESELVDNPLYIPVRCGAVFDDKNPMKILGDDTGENISEKRMSFCEFTPLIQQHFRKMPLFFVRYSPRILDR